MPFSFSVPDCSGTSTTIELDPGSSTFFVGANGSGKTRLAVRAEQHWGDKAHRISAHRALTLDPTVAKISEEKARYGLRFGLDSAHAGGHAHRPNHRWRSKAETALLDDYNYLVQALFADQANVALKTHNAAHAQSLTDLALTRLQKLSKIWERVLPHRALQISGDDIKASIDGQQFYSAAQMSDGERAVFYMLGQVLVAEPDSVLIFDEPELHVHRAILGRVWDEVEAARPDCAFLVITHDLEFSAARPGEKFAIRRYQAPGNWDIERVPDETGFSDEIVTLILGSRKPILFVEGTAASMDLAIYRACYPDWTVVPRGACESVIYSVVTMRHNESLTRVTCSGIVDADDYDEEDKRRMGDLGVAVLPVSEIENLFLLPAVAAAILEEERFIGDELEARLRALTEEVLAEVGRPGSIEKVVLRHCRRRIDRTLKRIDLTDAKSSAELAAIYVERTSALDISAVATDIRSRIHDAVEQRDLASLLANFDNKGLLSMAAKHLKSLSKCAFESWLVRAMRDPQATRLKSALRTVLPDITAL